MSKEKFAFDKTNFILLAVAMAVVIIGFILMTGPVSTPTHFEPDIFSARRIKVAPVAQSCALQAFCSTFQRFPPKWYLPEQDVLLLPFLQSLR